MSVSDQPEEFFTAEPRVGLAFVSLADSETNLYTPAAVQSVVREALLQAGFGVTDPAAPLRDIISPGQSVLLKPNWVHEKNFSGAGLECLVTHPEFIRAALKEVLLARPSKVIIGDAPIQSCNWEQFVPEAFRSELQEIAGSTPVEFVDFRRTILSSAKLD
jgi:uncharacterized protein (DUF362 family)